MCDTTVENLEQSFINKLLGEMKSQFNKTDINKPEESTATTTEEIAVEEDENHHETTVKQVDKADDPPEIEKNNSPPMEIDNDETEEKSSETVETDLDMVSTSGEASTDDSIVKRDSLQKPSKASPVVEDSNKTTNSRVTRKKNKGADCSLKRSARRSREFGESILQSAIARKEKSYNESSDVRQRPSRPLKPTQKVLDNLAAASQLKRRDSKETKVGKPARVSSKLSTVNVARESTESVTSNLASNGRRSKVKKHEMTSGLRGRPGKKQKLSEEEEEEILEEESAVGKEVDVMNCRRSQRISASRIKEEDDPPIESLTSVDVNIPIPIPEYKIEECSSVSDQLIASRLCLCTQPTKLYAEREEETVFCDAMDSISNRLVGCNRVVDNENVSMLRSSTRVPYVLLCEVHRNRLYRHNCCPTCGIFCTQGRFAECNNHHQYHKTCQISVGDKNCCPHCGISTPSHTIDIKMHSSAKLIYLTEQTVSTPTAKLKIQPKENHTTLYVPNGKLVVQIPTTSSISIDAVDTYDINNALQSIKNEDYSKLTKILGCRSLVLSTPIHYESSAIDGVSESTSGTLLHYAAINHRLSAVQMLVAAGIDIDMLDYDQNTALMVAVLCGNNDIVRYLIKAGSCITFKGTDGMSPLHLAAKSGNLVACSDILHAATSHHLINATDDGGWTPLVWACEHGHVDLVRYLLSRGADAQLRDVEHNLPLHWACFSGVVKIVELLLAEGQGDVQGENGHGDTPLHIAARQDHFNCVLFLLVKGAKVQTVNKEGELPIDCAVHASDCYNTILLNTHLQTVTLQGNTRKKIVLTNDITLGKESNPIQCLNTVDNEPIPVDYQYISANCYSANVHVNSTLSTLKCCTCERKCNTEVCKCVQNGNECWYDDGRLTRNFNFTDPPALFECNEACKCNVLTCHNRVVQRGLTHRFQLFRTRTKGWGMRTLRTIERGAFVCEYVGEVMHDVDADRRDDDSYMFDLDSADAEEYCIDARQYGNLSRFINHSCEPNLVPIKVFINHQDLRFPRIAFFANKDISAEDELSFDYGEKFWIIKYKSFTCDCGSSRCKYSINTIHKALANYSKRLFVDTK